MAGGGGTKFCADPCANAVCGPNSFCVVDNHNMNCICNEGFAGDANDLAVRAAAAKALGNVRAAQDLADLAEQKSNA